MYDNPLSEPSSSRALTSANETDNLIRRRLRISDPRDPAAIAKGLRELFPKEGELLQREASGLPIVSQPSTSARPAADGPTSAELQQAHHDIDRDLKALIGNSQLKDIEPELQGWSQAIRSITAEGHAAARLALDPRSRDRAFAARRALGDYARLARMVGALTCDHNQAYRRLAQSLDEAGALILVALGESLARIGFGGGRFLLQAPASELQARRDAVINALRNLTGATAESYGSQDWPYGLHGLRNVLKLLDSSGHADLRALFDENSLARLMDDLLDQASAHSARGLRALGATSTVAVQRLNRLVQVVGDNIDPGSPPLTAFLGSDPAFHRCLPKQQQRLSPTVRGKAARGLLRSLRHWRPRQGDPASSRANHPSRTPGRASRLLSRLRLLPGSCGLPDPPGQAALRHRPCDRSLPPRCRPRRRW